MTSNRVRRRRGRTFGVVAAGVVAVASAAVYAWPAMQPEGVADAAQWNAAAADAAEAVRSSRADVESSRAEEQKSRTAAFLGDSYNGGTGATTKDRRWTAVFAAETGWVEDNYGVGGTGYASRNEEIGKPAYYEQAPEVAASGDGVILVSGGRNDIALWKADPVGTAKHIAHTFSQLRVDAPNARIIASNPWWDDDNPPEELEAISNVVKASVESVAGTYVDIGQPLFGRPELISKDGIHPNDDGHAVLAAAMVAALK